MTARPSSGTFLAPAFRRRRPDPQIVPLTAELLRAIVARPGDGASLETLQQPGVAETIAGAGLAWAVIEGARTLGAFGACSLDLAPGVRGARGMLWCEIGAGARPRHVAFVIPFARWWLKELFAAGRFRRLEATLPAGARHAERVLRRLGLRRETALPMRAYALDGSDNHLYALAAREAK